MTIKINRSVPAPYAIQLEPTEGCNLACSFCGIQSIRNNGADADNHVHGKNSAPYKFMTLETLERVAQEAALLEWNPRWEFAMHGEPTMNKQIADMVSVIRAYHKHGYILLTTNGGGLLKNAPDAVERLFTAGLNTLAFDDYKHSRDANGQTYMQRIKAQLAERWSKQNLPPFKVIRYPADPDGNPHKRHHGRKLVFINDISDNTHGTHTLTNQGGNSFAKAPLLEERCAKPFRELSVRWDGEVALCCDDWPGKYRIGNVNTSDLEELWYSEAFEAARRRLYAKDRAFGPCNGCNVRTKRNGLLPDQKGNEEMLPPDKETNAVIAALAKNRVISLKPV